MFNMLIGNFFYGIGVLGNNLINLLRIGDNLFHLSNGRKLFFFLCSFDWISEILLFWIVLIGLFLHDMFLVNNKRINFYIIKGIKLSFKITLTNALR